ncbi:MAG: hypothetical protein EXR60_00745 [Dehalococcoidia bacterium]|nr:hypothetical protein [Dehalococcoidia bacterium]
MDGLAFHRQNPFVAVPPDVASKFLAEGQLLYVAIYRVPLGALTLPDVVSLPVRVPKTFSVTLSPDGATFMGPDEFGKSVERSAEGPCIRVIVQTGESGMQKAALVGKERLREIESTLCLCLKGIPLLERVFESFMAPGSEGKHLELVARSRVGVEGFNLKKFERDIKSVDLSKTSYGLKRSLQWFQSAYWETDATARFTKLFLAILAVIEEWAGLNPSLIPPREDDGGKNDSPRAKARAYFTHHLNLLDRVEPVCQCFDRLYRARHNVFKAALRDRITHSLLRESEALALSVLQFEILGYFKAQRFVS